MLLAAAWKDLDAAFLTLSALMTVAVVLGAYMTALSWRTFRRTGDRAHRYLFLGMLLLTVGAVVQGFAYNILGWTLEWSQALGAVVLVAALTCFILAVR